MFQNHVTFITGAGTGIGEATALFFASQGARVALLDRDAAGVEKNAALIAEKGGEAIALAGDMRDRSSLATAVDATIARFGRIDSLINNAGIYPRKPFLEITEEEWDTMLDINLKGVYRMTQLVVPHMIAQGGGKVVNISSVTFFVAPPLLSHYVASKGGVIGLSRVLAKELGPQNVLVNCVTPGAIQTESEKHFVSKEQEQEFLYNQSIKRRLQPLDVARVCAFLAGPWSDGMTGQTLNVDAGWALY